MRKALVLLLVATCLCSHAMAQLTGGHISGSFQTDMQTSKKDNTTGAKDIDEKLLMNSRADLIYVNGPVEAGLRYEAYLNPMLGFDKNYKGQGVANYYVTYHGDRIDFTAGYFYEQFGSGLTLRAYEDRNLGYDNALYGFKLQARPIDGILLKGIIGRQRYCWELGDGIVRGVDAELSLNQLVKPLAESEWYIQLGGSVVSRYEGDTTIAAITPGYKLNIPHNVAAASARVNVAFRQWSLNMEYARKGQDPNFMNNYIYRNGEALTLALTYATRGFSANLQAKRIDNMLFKSERAASDVNGPKLYTNYIPAINKEHTYALLSMYPYATQAQGEMGVQGDIIWQIPKESWLGGRHGMEVHLNSAVITALDIDSVGGRGTKGYTSDFLSHGGLYYGDVTVEVDRRLNRNIKLAATYGYQVVNPEIDGHSGSLHHNHIVVGDLTWKINRKNALRFEGEWLGSDSRYYGAGDDKRSGDWIMGLVEYNFTSHWFFSLSDQYPYHDGTGNYYNVTVGYTHKATRLQIGYGKQREGMICIGGVCRQMPALNGISISLSTSF